MLKLKIVVHVMVIVATRTFREKNRDKAESFSRLYFNNVYAEVDNRERARARVKKQRRRICIGNNMICSDI